MQGRLNNHNSGGGGLFHWESEGDGDKRHPAKRERGKEALEGIKENGIERK